MNQYVDYAVRRRKRLAMLFLNALYWNVRHCFAEINQPIERAGRRRFSTRAIKFS